MRAYFFLIFLGIFMVNPLALAQIAPSTSTSPVSDNYYPAIKISRKLSEMLFIDKPNAVLNCPMLFDNTWDYPNGTSIALCDDAQLACLRYGLLIEKIKVSKGPLLAELKESLALEKKEVGLRLRGCQLILEATTIENKTMEEAAGYPLDSYGPAVQ